MALVILFLLGVQGEEDYNRRLAVLIERMDKHVDDSVVELLEKGSLSEAKIRLGDTMLNQFTYAFKIVYEEYIAGKRPFTDELSRAQTFLKDVVNAKGIQGSWVAKAAHKRIIPRLQSVVANLTFEPGWTACNGSEQDCISCQVLRKKK